MTNTEKIFSYLDQYAEQQNGVYLESIIDACEKWLDDPDAIELEEPIEKEDVRKGIQLAVLKGMRESAQPNHQMTPDSIGIILSYLLNKLLPEQQPATFLDPAAGTGNLLFTVMNQFHGKAAASAVEIDDVLIRLAAVTANLLEQHVAFYMQDALRPLMVDPVDAVLCDVPVGYYPDDEQALNYELMPAEGHAFSHHLYLEQSMNYVKPGGYGLFIVPADLLTGENGEAMALYLKKQNFLRAIFQLPSSLFKNERFAKSIIVLENPSKELKVTPEVLLASVPEFSDGQAMARFFERVNKWTEEKKE